MTILPTQVISASYLSTLRERVRLHNLPLTLRGVVVLCLILYLVLGPVRLESDIVASVFAYSVLGVMCMLVLVTLMQGRSVRNSLTIHLLGGGESSGQLFSEQSSRIVMRTSPLKLCPLFVLRIIATLEQGEVLLGEHSIFGKNEVSRVLSEQVTFPHRGEWRVKEVALSFGDQFGLTIFRWKLTSSEVCAVFRVRPAMRGETHLPIISSSVRSGDELIDMHERQGEPFDLKPYHPADGMRKILWKVYAKTGELISRHAERAMTPEGQVIAFVLASPEDDTVCGSCLSYLRKLEDLNLEIFIGCEGMRGAQLARSSIEAEDLLIESVWAAKHSTTQVIGQELEEFLAQIGKESPSAGPPSGPGGGNRVQRVLVFASAARLMNEEAFNMFATVGDILDARGITPLFCISRDAHLRHKRATSAAEQIREFIVDTTNLQERVEPTYLPRFVSLSASRSWQVLL